MEGLLHTGTPKQNCYGEECPRFAGHIADSGKTQEELMATCSRMTGPAGKPGDRDFTCGIFVTLGLYSEEGSAE